MLILKRGIKLNNKRNKRKNNPNWKKNIWLNQSKPLKESELGEDGPVIINIF